ncbi:MAG: DUF1761 domain-containing protein [Acidobacteriota bacterium]
MFAVDFDSINFLAVAVAGLAMFLLGGLWYSPLLFGRLWMDAHGHSEEDLERLSQGMGKAYGLSLVSYWVIAGVFALLMQPLGVSSALGGAVLGVVLWLGFAATLGLTSLLFSERKAMTYVIDALYQLVGFLVIGAILGAWS